MAENFPEITDIELLHPSNFSSDGRFKNLHIFLNYRDANNRNVFHLLAKLKLYEFSGENTGKRVVLTELAKVLKKANNKVLETSKIAEHIRSKLIKGEAKVWLEIPGIDAVEISLIQTDSNDPYDKSSQPLHLLKDSLTNSQLLQEYISSDLYEHIEKIDKAIIEDLFIKKIEKFLDQIKLIIGKELELPGIADKIRQQLKSGIGELLLPGIDKSDLKETDCRELLKIIEEFKKREKKAEIPDDILLRHVLNAERYSELEEKDESKIQEIFKKIEPLLFAKDSTGKTVMALILENENYIFLDELKIFLNGIIKWPAYIKSLMRKLFLANSSDALIFPAIASGSDRLVQAIYMPVEELTFNDHSNNTDTEKYTKEQCLCLTLKCEDGKNKTEYYSPLTYAVSLVDTNPSQFKAVILALLNQGANIDGIDKSGRTGLDIAIAKQDAELIEYLQDMHKAKKYSTYALKQALYAAIKASNDKFVCFLLQADFIHVGSMSADKFNQSTAFLSLKISAKEILQALVEADSPSASLIMWLLTTYKIYFNYETISELERKINKKDVEITSIFADFKREAGAKKIHDAVNIFLDSYKKDCLYTFKKDVSNALKTEDINLRAQKDLTALMMLMNSKITEVDKAVEFLLINKASQSLQDITGKTALHHAILNEDENIRYKLVALLIKNTGTELEITDNRASTPLHYAAASGDLKVLTLLIHAAENKFKKEKQKFDSFLVAQDTQGNTALHIAVEKCYLDVVKVLLRHTANFRVKNNVAGYQPIHLACINAMQQTLEGKEAYIDILKFIVERNPVAIDAVTRDMETVLHLVADYIDTAVMRLLIEELKADIWKKDVCGRNFLYRAIESFSRGEDAEEEWQKLMLFNNAFINAKQISSEKLEEFINMPIQFNSQKNHTILLYLIKHIFERLLTPLVVLKKVFVKLLRDKKLLPEDLNKLGVNIQLIPCENINLDKVKELLKDDRVAIAVCNNLNVEHTSNSENKGVLHQKYTVSELKEKLVLPEIDSTLLDDIRKAFESINIARAIHFIGKAPKVELDNIFNKLFTDHKLATLEGINKLLGRYKVFLMNYVQDLLRIGVHVDDTLEYLRALDTHFNKSVSKEFNVQLKRIKKPLIDLLEISKIEHQEERFLKACEAKIEQWKFENKYFWQSKHLVINNTILLIRAVLNEDTCEFFYYAHLKPEDKFEIEILAKAVTDTLEKIEKDVKLAQDKFYKLILTIDLKDARLEKLKEKIKVAINEYLASGYNATNSVQLDLEKKALIKSEFPKKYFAQAVSNALKNTEQNKPALVDYFHEIFSNPDMQDEIRTVIGDALHSYRFFNELKIDANEYSCFVDLFEKIGNEQEKLKAIQQEMYEVLEKSKLNRIDLDSEFHASLNNIIAVFFTIKEKICSLMNEIFPDSAELNSFYAQTVDERRRNIMNISCEVLKEIDFNIAHWGYMAFEKIHANHENFYKKNTLCLLIDEVKTYAVKIIIVYFSALLIEKQRLFSDKMSKHREELIKFTYLLLMNKKTIFDDFDTIHFFVMVILEFDAIRSREIISAFSHVVVGNLIRTPIVQLESFIKNVPLLLTKFNKLFFEALSSVEKKNVQNNIIPFLLSSTHHLNGVADNPSGFFFANKLTWIARKQVSIIEVKDAQTGVDSKITLFSNTMTEILTACFYAAAAQGINKTIQDLMLIIDIKMADFAFSPNREYIEQIVKYLNDAPDDVRNDWLVLFEVAKDKLQLNRSTLTYFVNILTQSYKDTIQAMDEEKIAIFACDIVNYLFQAIHNNEKVAFEFDVKYDMVKELMSQVKNILRNTPKHYLSIDGKTECGETLRSIKDIYKEHTEKLTVSGTFVFS